jgi:hypothetical protein
LDVYLEYLDIVMEPFEMVKNFLSIVFKPGNEDIATISRGPDDMIFGFVDSMGAFSKVNET